VTQGTFAAKLDFGSNALSGANRWIEIAIRRNSGESYVTLSPREQIASAPYAVRTLSAASADNAQQLGGVAASEYVTNTNLGDNAIRNQTTLQANSNFNISGNGFFGNRVGVGTTTPLHRLALAGGPAWTTNSWGGSMDLENASAIGWRANAGGTRFGMGHSTDGFFLFRTASELGTTTTAPIYDLKIDNAGNIGVGSLAINTDVSQAKLNIFSPSLGYGFVQNLGAVTVGSYVDATGGAYGTRSNHPLQFFTNNLSPQVTLATNGNFGIGTTTPNAKLAVVGGASPGVSVTSQGNALIGTSSGAGFASIFGENTSLSGGFGVYGKGVSGYALFAEGHTGQSRDKGGLVKAMAYVNETGAIVRCFNSFNVSPIIANCGFSTSHTLTGRYVINFGFIVSDRFVITEGHGFTASHSYGAGLGNPNAIEVFMVDFSNTLREGPFTIVVF
jgi:hypothetical protein